jgi:YHS domain-containing protein
MAQGVTDWVESPRMGAQGGGMVLKSPRFRWFSLVLAAVGLSLLALPAVVGESQPVNRSTFGLAMKGYDPVAYFVQAAPRRGLSDFDYEWRGAKWRFTSAAHRHFFAQNPDQYAPQFGGYCAWRMMDGEKVDFDHRAWRVWQGKLYLFSARGMVDRWEDDPAGHIARAEAQWARLSAAR